LLFATLPAKSSRPVDAGLRIVKEGRHRTAPVKVQPCRNRQFPGKHPGNFSPHITGGVVHPPVLEDDPVLGGRSMGPDVGKECSPGAKHLDAA
jgi:hypothetical protein